jgi:hypothetical protein
MFWIMVIYTLILLSMLIEIFMGLRSKRTMMIGCIGLLCGHVFWSKPCLGEVQWSYVATHTSHTGTCEGLAKEVSERTSMVMGKNFHYIDLKADDIFAQPWLWMTADTFTHMNETLKESLKYWLKRGGFLVLEGSEGREELKHWLNDLTSSQSLPSPGWVPIPPNHEVMRSFYLLDALPMCQDNPLVWYGFHFDQRLAVLSIPFALSKSLTDTQDAQTSACKPDLSFEKGVRVFINILMVALTTDYKKDQIHMKEILKRLH